MKRQASAIAAIFQDPELLQKGEDYANNAAGATAKAMNTVLDTIEVRISRLQNEAQTFWQELINSNDVKKLIDGLSAALKLTNSLVTASHGLFNGNGTAGLLGLLAGSTQSAFNKLRNGANSSGGLISFTGTGTYVGGVKLGKSGAASYSSVMGNDGLVYSADDMAAIAKVSKALHEASGASLSFDDALQKSGIDLAALSDNGKSLIATMKNGTAGADELIVRSQSLAKGFNSSGEALKAFGRSILSSLASGLVMAGISVAISAIASAVDNYVHRLDTAIDKGKEFSQSIQQQTKQYSDNQDQIESLREEYTSLSRGVDEHGKNVSLTADQYKRYKEIVAQIVQLSPELARGYSDENGYLVDRNKLIDEAIAKQKEYTAEAQRSRFTSNNFATEMNAQLATVQQSKQSSIKGQKSWFERVTSSKTWQDYLTRFQTPTDRDKLLNADDIYAEAQQNFIGQLQKLYSSSSNSTEKTLDEYLQSQFGISGATLDNVDKIAKSISKITAGLKPQNDSQATQFNNQITALDKAATNWVKDAETVDSVNQAVRDNFTSFVENAVAGYDKLNDAQKNAIRNSISNLTYADILKGNKTEQDQSILYGTWQVDDSKRRQQQDKYADMVKLLQDSAVQRTMSNASKIDTSLNYADYEKQYKQNLKKIEKVLNSVNASEGLSLKPADIKQLITLTPVDQDGNDLHADPQAMVDRLKATLVNGENLVKDMTLDQINITYPIVQEFAEEHPGLKVDLDQAKRLVNLQVRIEELKNKSVASYSNLKTQVESYTTALGGLNDITANNQIITTDMYNALQSAGVSIEDLNSVVREFGVDSEGYTTYLVENIDKLKEFTKVANDAAKTDISANIDAQRRRYAELVEQLDQVIGENYDYVKSNHTLTESRKDDVRSIQEQLDQTEDLLDSYAALQSQVSATANAYSAYQKAKEYDSRTDFGSEAVEMVSELANDLANATYGTEAFKSAMNAIVPKSALTNMDDAIQRIKDTQKYLNSLDSQHYFTKSDDGALQGLNYETFVKNGLKSQNGIQVFTGTEGNFRLNDTITDIQQVEKAFGMTLPMVQAFDEALKRAGVTSRSMFASLSGDDSQNQIYRTLQNLNDAENQLQEAINQGVDTAPFKKKVDDAKADIDDLANGARQRVSDYLNAMDQMNELDVRGGTEGQREALEAKLNQKPTQLDVELVDKNLDSEIETLQNGAKQKKIELYAKINHVDASNVDSDTVDKWAQNRLSRDLELKKNSSIFLDDESNAAQSEMDKLTQSLDSVKSSSGDLVKSLDNTTQAVNNLSSVMSGGSSSGVKSEGAKNSSKQTAEVNVSNATANKNIKQTEDAGAKLYDIINNGFASINLKNQDALSKVASFKNAYLDAVNTVNQNPLVMQANTGIAFTKSGSSDSKKKGKAKANGGVVNGDSRALVGELGPELVVNPNTGTYYTVGDGGAEFVSLPNNAIVFNHLQTRNLLSGGRTPNRGRAFASGNVGRADYSKYDYLNTLSKKQLISFIKQSQEEAVKNGYGDSLKHPVFGNIDVSNRQALNWNQKNIDKYKDFGWQIPGSADENSYSTLLGSNGVFGDYIIAYSPLLQDYKSGEPLLLPYDTVSDYFNDLISKLDALYGAHKWTEQQFLALDHNGITWDTGVANGKLIHDLCASVAAVGDQAGSKKADYNSEAMHYSGQYWDLQNVLSIKKRSGKAKANGGIVNGESRALVGELGQELVVNPNTGKYYTVGDSGAEFVSLPKNAIVFNHLQTKQLLGGNHTGSRGTALASGNAYVDSSGGNNGILGAFTTTLTPATDKSSKATSAAKSAGKEISKAAKEAADDWVTAFKNAAEKLRNNYTSGKMDAEQYFDALTKLYQQYYDGYGRKSDENLKKLKDVWTAIYNTEASDLDTKRSNGEITERQYLDGLRNLYKRFYGDLNVYAKEYADAQKDFAQKAKSAYQNVLQAGSSVVSHQIKQLQNQMNGAVSALQAQKDAADRSFEMQLRPLNAEIKHYEKLQKALNKQIKAKTKEQNAIEKVITAKNKEISAIQEAAQARQTDLDLQKAQYELARAEHQRTQYTYTSDKGFVYRSNPTNVKDARENLKEKTENSRVQQINNEINALTKEKEAIQDEIDKIQEVIDRYADKIDAIQEQIDAIQELKDATDQYYDDAIYNIQQQYQTQIDALQKIQDMWDQASDMFDFATSLQLLESFGLSLSDVTNNAGASIDLVKGKLADVLAYMYQNNDAAKQVWSTILGIDLSQITPNIDNFALGIKGVSDYASMASGNVRSLNGDLSAAQMSGMMAQGGLIGAANAATQLGTAASTTSPQELANTMAQLSATDMTGFSNAIGSLTANAASLDALNASLTQTLAIMQGLGAQDTFGALYNQFVAFVTNFEALANQFQQDMTALFGQGQAAGNDKNSQSAGWFDGFVQQVEDMNERTSAALQNQIEQWTNFQQLMVGVLGVDGNGGGDKGGEGGQGQQSGDGGSTASSGSASADSIIGSLILAATEMNEAFMKWEETLNEFIVGEGGFTDFTNQVMEMITNMANTIKEQCEAAISAINEMVEAVASANAALANMSFSVGSSGSPHPAHAAGTPTGLKHDEHHALVGELGPETVVSGDKYRVVGKHGAELVNLKRGDIVLNHQQTARLFKSGAAHASGIGNLIPAGQPAFMNKLANISSDLLSANMKQLTPRLFTGVNVKLAAADGGGTSVTIKDLHVSLPNFNSDKADDLIRDLSSMTLKAVQKYNRH